VSLYKTFHIQANGPLQETLDKVSRCSQLRDCSAEILESGMSDGDYARKLAELERLLNDPEVPMEPSLVWSLLDEISQASAPGCTGTAYRAELICSG
jgi:hypothetical protein